MELKKKYRRQKSQSVYHSILVTMLVVLIIEVLLMMGSLYFSNITQQLDQNASDILQKQVENRQTYLETTLTEAQLLTTLADSINDETQSLLSSGDLRLDTLDQGSENCLPLMKNVSSSLLNTLRSKHVTGVFLAFSTHSLDSDEASEVLPCLYIRDLDPDTAPSSRNADLMLEHSPKALVENLRISTDSAWSPAILAGSAEVTELVKPAFQAAWDDGGRLDASDYGHWTKTPFTVTGDNHEAIAYSIPLILPDGTVYGVLGVELLVSYLQSKLPSEELQTNGYATYMLATTQDTISKDQSIQFEPVLISTASSSPAIFEDTISLNPSSKGDYFFVSGSTRYHAAMSTLTLYNRNAPFSGDHWLLVGVVSERILFSFSIQVMRLLWLSALLTLIVGILCSLMASQRFCRPISQLSSEVAAAQETRTSIPTLSATGIQELDQFASAITNLSRDVLTSSTKFLRIMEMASVEIGGYELQTFSGRPVSIYVTDNFFRILGMPDVDAKDLTVQRFRSILDTLNRSCPNNPISDGAVLYKVTLPDGNLRYVRMETTVEPDRQVGLAEDVTFVTLERLRIEHERDYDPLTGLYNRLSFQRECQQLFESPEQLKHAAFLMMDLDDLKFTNDSFGHDVGDRYIRLVGKCISRNIPVSTLCARISGDEFNVLFYGYPSQQRLRLAIQQLQEALQSASLELPNGRALPVSVSCGIAWYPEDSLDLGTLKKYADFAMYQVKHSGKGRMEEFNSSQYQQELYDNQIRHEFHHLVKNEAVSYHFQPIFSAVTGQAIAYEALMRLNLPTLRSPETVLKLAREEDMLHDIERITLFHATQTYMDLEDRGMVPKRRKLFVNTIASQHLTPDEEAEFTRRFSRLLPQFVTEITEEEDLDLVALERKRSFPGSPRQFALDDYGSGFNGVKNLLELSPQYIKVDICIIRGIDTDRDKQQIVRNLVAYARPWGMQIIAEGLETAAEVETVLGLGVDLLQGYYLARPAQVPSSISSQGLSVIRQFHRSAKS